MTDNAEGPGPDPSQGPYRLTGLVATAWRFYSARFAPLFIIFLIANLLASAPLLLELDVASTTDRLLASVLGLLAAVILSIAFGLTALICEAYLRDEYIGAGEAWRRLLPNIQPVLGAAFLAALILFTIGTALPPIALMLRPLFYGPPILMQIVVIEGLVVGAAWARSKDLMKGHWGRVFTYLMTVALGLYLFASSLVFAVAGAVLENSNDTIELLLDGFVAVVLAVGYPFMAVAVYVAYADVAALEE